MKLVLTNQNGSFDITELVSTIQWSGSCDQCARTLSVELLAEDAPDCSIGSNLTLMENQSRIFTGIVLTRTRSTASHIIDLTAFDYGIYLNRNQTSKKFVGITPEAGTAALSSEFGIAVGTLAATGVPVSRKLFGKTLYEVIMTLYTLASQSTGKKYFVCFSGASLNVLEKGTAAPMLLIKGGSNLIDASTTESAEQIINRVAVYDKDENLLYTQNDAASAALYGVMQTVTKQQTNIDVAAKLLKDSQPQQKITVNCLGDTACTSGRAVMLQESTTGLYGKFFIDSDTHQWKNGVYTNSLTLNLNAVMDEKTAGEEIKAASGAASSGNAKYQQYLDRLQSQSSVN